MTTAQAPTNGHRVFPPFSVENPSQVNSADLPTNKAKNNQAPLESQISDLQSPDPAPALPASAYHVPPKRFVPKAYPYRRDDTLDLPPETEPLPERCQFMFSDGRQCTMGRSDIHPSLCTYHSDREDQLFGDPGGSFVTRKLDLPELYSACRDLTTAAGVNRALGQVFRLLAQRRISRQEAATFAKLGHLLLQTISAAHAESVAAPLDNVRANATGLVILSESALPDKQRTSPQIGSHSATQHQNGASEHHLDSPNAHSSASPITPAVTSEPQAVPAAIINSLGINPSATSVCNPREISTYENAEVKVVHNEHLRKNGRAV